MGKSQTVREKPEWADCEGKARMGKSQTVREKPEWEKVRL
jgi:hypothetical protein